MDITEAYRQKYKNNKVINLQKLKDRRYSRVECKSLHDISNLYSSKNIILKLSRPYIGLKILKKGGYRQIQNIHESSDCKFTISDKETRNVSFSILKHILKNI